ncbi:MAG: putative membrane protein YdbT with pleckstrin-like domain [Acidimicrobiales bacterium]
MGFNPKLLNNNEEVLLDVRPHWWFITPQVALVVLGLLVLAVAAALRAPAILLYILGAGVLAALLNLAWQYLNWTGVNFVVTTDRLIFRSGVFSKAGIEIPLERINTVFFNTTLFERAIGSGDLSVESAGEGGQQNFDNVRKPQLIQQEIYRAMEINKTQEFSAMAQAHAAAAGVGAERALSVPEQIEQLDQLRLRGVITEAEFQTKKSDLLDRM